MTASPWARVSAFLVASMAGMAATAPVALAAAAAPRSGIDTEYVSSASRPQDDLYRYLNGKWLDQFQIPADKGRYVSFTEVADRTEDQLHGLVDDLARRPPATAGDAQRAESAAGSEARSSLICTQASWTSPAWRASASSRSNTHLPPSMRCHPRSKYRH